VSAGPPPVPGGRTPEEREAARREREARRAARAGKAPRPAAAPPPRAAPPPAAAARPAASPSAIAAPPAPEPDDAWLGESEYRAERRRPPGRGSGVGPPRQRGHRRWGRLVAVAFLAVLAIGTAWFANSLFQPFAGDGEGNVRVVIPEGATLEEIADLLEREGVVSSASFFELRTRLSGRSGELKPGPYELKRDMSYTAVLDRLEQGVPPNVVMVTVPEGRSRGEVAPLVKRLEGSYLRATRRHPALDPSEYGAKDARGLEGFLYPATYELKKGQPVRRLVARQLAAFEENFDKVDLSYARRRKLSPYDVLTIASLVERETAIPKERPLVASVIYNRLRDDIRLDIDATTRFVSGNWSEPLKESELEDPDPYNTRVHFGLPPGPIGSPGLASIKAAARPAKTDYIFYVAAVCGNGRHRFAESNAEFERYVAEYEQARAERGGKSPTNC
jgi:peptidoglycan lytic transglycosylase G